MLDTPMKKRGSGGGAPEKFSISTDPPPSKLPKNSEGGGGFVRLPTDRVTN